MRDGAADVAINVAIVATATVTYVAIDCDRSPRQIGTDSAMIIIHFMLIITHTHNY